MSALRATVQVAPPALLPSYRAVEVVTCGSMHRMIQAIRRMQRTPARELVLQLPDDHIPLGVTAFRITGREGWVVGLSGRREWHVPVPPALRRNR